VQIKPGSIQDLSSAKRGGSATISLHSQGCVKPQRFKGFLRLWLISVLSTNFY
jgi:hypothetical protein